MSFLDDMGAFAKHVERRRHDLYVGIATEVSRSVKYGSTTTGAPGQPVDTGALLNSWILDIGPAEAEISTNVVYAPGIEDAIGPHGPILLRSKVGGFHSVKMTVAAANNIQTDVLGRIAP